MSRNTLKMPELNCKINKNSLRLSDLFISDNQGNYAKYIQAKKLNFIENQTSKTWEVLHSFDSVCILLLDVVKNAFVIVRQFRPAVFLKQNNIFANDANFEKANLQKGYTYELCAGLLDKQKSLEQTAIEEVQEETGYEISQKDLHYVGKFFGSTSLSGSVNYLFFAKVSSRKNLGGGVDGEVIDVLHLRVEDSLEFALDFDIPKTTSLSFGISWYHYHFKGSK